MDKVINWGILGCGNIANKFANSVKELENIKIIGVASNTPNKAKDFAEKHDIPSSYNDYNTILQNNEIDAFYIATTHNFHYKNALQVLKAGKHLLCEKPFTVNSKEMKDLIKIAKSNNVFMMEAMWTRFLPVMGQIREWLDDKKIGDIKQIRATFGFNAPKDPNSRLYNLELAGGALLDVGIYPLSFANMIKKEKHISLKALAEIGVTGVDEQSSYILKYSDGCLAYLNSHINSYEESKAEILGTKGRIYIDNNFYTSEVVILALDNQEEIIIKRPFNQEAGFKFEIEAASNSIRDGKIENDVMPLSDTLQVLETIDEIKEQIGLLYPNDKN